MFFEGFAVGRDPEILGTHLKSKLLGDFIFQSIDFLALKFNNPIAVLANDMMMVGMFTVIRVVILVVLAEVHFLHQATLG